MIGTALKRVRTIFDYSASEMSELLGISRSYLSEIETNAKKPPMRLLEQYSKVTGIKVSSLMLLAEQYDSEVNDSGNMAKITTAKLLNSLLENMAMESK